MLIHRNIQRFISMLDPRCKRIYMILKGVSMYTIKIQQIKACLFACIVIIICAQFSNPHSKQSKDRPEVNFYGSLIYSDGQEIEVENITINNLVRDIVVYHQPPTYPTHADQKNDKGFDLEINRTKLSLDKICRIRTLDPLFIYRNRNYVKIEVLSNDQEQVHNVFLIEQRKEVSCTLQKSQFEKEVSFSALKELKIFGRKAQQYMQAREHGQQYCSFDQPQNNQSPAQTEEQDSSITAQSSRQGVQPQDPALLLTKTNALIDALEKKTQELPQNSITDTLKNMLQELRDSITGLFS